MGMGLDIVFLAGFDLPEADVFDVAPLAILVCAVREALPDFL
jgi:hypothetical protein